jgi:hypothetical protein
MMAAVSLAGAATAIAPAAWAQWIEYPTGCATSVTPGFVTGCGSAKDQPVYETTNNGTSWAQKGTVRGDFVTQSVDGTGGFPWLVTSGGAIYHWNNRTNDFTVFDDSKAWATVAVGSGPYDHWATTTDGRIFVLAPVAGGLPQWEQVPGSATKVALFEQTVQCTDDTGSLAQIHVPVVINALHQIFMYRFTSVGSCVAGSGCSQGCFQQITGTAIDISTDEALMLPDYAIYFWGCTKVGCGWVSSIGSTPGGPTTHIGTIKNAETWAINSKGSIFTEPD